MLTLRESIVQWLDKCPESVIDAIREISLQNEWEYFDYNNHRMRFVTDEAYREILIELAKAFCRDNKLLYRNHGSHVKNILIKIIEKESA